MTRHSVARRDSPARPIRRRTSSRDPPGDKSRRLAEDLHLLFEALHLALQSLRFRLLRLADGQCLGRAGRQVLGAPLAELPGANAKLRRHLRQPLVAVQQPLHRLRLELPREAPSGSPLRHPSLLGCLGSLANPPAPGAKSKVTAGLTSRLKEWSRSPELPPPDAGCWCSRNKRRPYVSLIWCGIHRVIETGSDLGSEPTAGELHEPINLTP